MELQVRKLLFTILALGLLFTATSFAQTPQTTAQNKVAKALIEIHCAIYISAYIIANFGVEIYLADDLSAMSHHTLY